MPVGEYARHGPQCGYYGHSEGRWPSPGAAGASAGWGGTAPVFAHGIAYGESTHQVPPTMGGGEHAEGVSAVQEEEEGEDLSEMAMVIFEAVARVLLRPVRAEEAGRLCPMLPGWTREDIQTGIGRALATLEASGQAAPAESEGGTARSYTGGEAFSQSSAWQRHRGARNRGAAIQGRLSGRLGAREASGLSGDSGFHSAPEVRRGGAAHRAPWSGEETGLLIEFMQRWVTSRTRVPRGTAEGLQALLPGRTLGAIRCRMHHVRNMLRGRGAQAGRTRSFRAFAP